MQSGHKGADVSTGGKLLYRLDHKEPVKDPIKCKSFAGPLLQAIISKPRVNNFAWLDDELSLVLSYVILS